MTTTAIRRLGTAALAAGALALAGCAAPAPAPATTEASPTAAPTAVVDDRPLPEQLRQGLVDHDGAYVDAVIAAGVDVNHDYGSLVTPLQVAILAGNVDGVAALLDAGADATAVTTDGLTPLHITASTSHGEIVPLLVAAGADLNAYADDRFGTTPLHLAAEQGTNRVLEALLVAGADVDAKNLVYDVEPIIAAAFWGNLEGLQILIAYGADPFTLDPDGQNLAYVAYTNNQQEVIDFVATLGIELEV